MAVVSGAAALCTALLTATRPQEIWLQSRADGVCGLGRESRSFFCSALSSSCLQSLLDERLPPTQRFCNGGIAVVALNPKLFVDGVPLLWACRGTDILGNGAVSILVLSKGISNCAPAERHGDKCRLWQVAALHASEFPSFLACLLLSPADAITKHIGRQHLASQEVNLKAMRLPLGALGCVNALDVLF